MSLEASERKVVLEIDESKTKFMTWEFIEGTRLKITTDMRKAYSLEEVERVMYLGKEFGRKKREEIDDGKSLSMCI